MRLSLVLCFFAVWRRNPIEKRLSYEIQKNRFCLFVFAKFFQEVFSIVILLGEFVCLFPPTICFAFSIAFNPAGPFYLHWLIFRHVRYLFWTKYFLRFADKTVCAQACSSCAVFDHQSTRSKEHIKCFCIADGLFPRIFSWIVWAKAIWVIVILYEPSFKCLAV